MRGNGRERSNWERTDYKKEIKQLKVRGVCKTVRADKKVVVDLETRENMVHLTVRCSIPPVTQKIRFRNGKDQAWYFNPLLMKKKEKENPKLLQFIGIKKIKLNWFSQSDLMTFNQSNSTRSTQRSNCQMAVSRTTIKPILGYLQISIFANIIKINKNRYKCDFSE